MTEIIALDSCALHCYHLLAVNEWKDLIKHWSLLKRDFWPSISPISTLKPCSRVPRPPPALFLLHVWKREASRVIEWENRSNQRRSSTNERSNRLFCELNFMFKPPSRRRMWFFFICDIKSMRFGRLPCVVSCSPPSWIFQLLPECTARSSFGIMSSAAFLKLRMIWDQI